MSLTLQPEVHLVPAPLDEGPTSSGRLTVLIQRGQVLVGDPQEPGLRQHLDLYAIAQVEFSNKCGNFRRFLRSIVATGPAHFADLAVYSINDGLGKMKIYFYGKRNALLLQ